MQAEVMPTHIARKDVIFRNLFIRFMMLPPHCTKYRKSAAQSKDRQDWCAGLFRAPGLSSSLSAAAEGLFLPENA
jgi:hypothetical protein